MAHATKTRKNLEAAQAQHSGDRGDGRRSDGAVHHGGRKGFDVESGVGERVD